MKHLIIRRKQIRFLLCVLLFLVGLLAIDASGLFFGRIKFIFEDKLGKKLKAVVKIEQIEGGIFRRLRLKNFEVYHLRDKQKVLVLKVKTASVDYRLWDLLLNFFTLGSKKYYLRNISLFSPEIYGEELLVLNDRQEKEVSEKNQPNNYPFYAKKLFGGISEELTISIYNADIFLYGGKPAIQLLSGQFTLGKDWLKAKDIQAEVQGMPLFLNCRFYGLYSGPQFDIQIKSRFLDSFLNINGKLESFSIFGMFDFVNRGRLYCFGEASLAESEFILKRLSVADVYNANGTFDFKKRIAHFEIMYNEKNVLVLDSSFPSLSRQKTFIKLNDLILGKVDIFSDITIDTAVKFAKNKKKGSFVEGRITTSNTKLNNGNFYDLIVDYAISKEEFVIRKFSLGDGKYSLKGKIKLGDLYYSDFNFEIKDGRLADFWMLGNDQSGRKVEGTLNGKFKIWGNLFSLNTKGHLEGKNGDLENFKYENAYAVVESQGPLIRIIDGSLRMKDGDYLLGGQIDLRRIGTSDIIRQLKLTPAGMRGKRFQKGLEEEKETFQMIVGRDISKRVHVDYKAEHVDETKYQDKQDAEVEFKYDVKKGQTLKMRLKDEDEFIGLEHKIKF